MLPKSQFRKSKIAFIVSIAIAPAAALGQSDVAQNDPTEVIVVTANPLERTQLNSAQPISVLDGDELRQKHAHTLGETLSKEPGINNTHFANVAGSPIIRGLDGPRVKVTQNGLDTGDVSRGSPDHAVTTETSTATQVEILRGPATLLYGSGAIGGVVNVVDNRIAKQRVDGVEGSYGVGANTAADQRDANVAINAGQDLANGNSLVWHFDGFVRDSDDYEVPNFINDEGEAGDTVENTFVEAQGANFGLSYVTDSSYLGFSYGRLEQTYGIPGHEHGHEEEEEEEEEHHDDHEGEHDHDEEHEHEHEAGPYADLTQNRIQLAGGWSMPDSAIRQVDLKIGYTDYQHSEIEDGTPATTFTNEQYEARLTARHQPLAGWDGAFGVQWFGSDQRAVGEEAYTLPSDTQRTGLFWVGEQTFGAYNWQLGARYEHVRMSTEDDHVRLDTEVFDPISLSAGFTRPLTDTVSLAVNLSHAQRSPSANEIFSNGAHFATRTYEIGLAYEPHETSPNHVHIDENEQAVELEVSNNLDIGFHYEAETLHAQVNFFYNRVDDFVYGRVTGFDSDDLHIEDHGHEEDHGAEEGHDDDGHEDEHAHGGHLPVIAYEQRDVELFGYELEAGWAINDNWELTGFSDFTRARLRDGGDLPRIPAQRIGADIHYSQQGWEAELGYIYYGAQNRVALNETSTDSYGLVNAQVSYYPNWSASQSFGIYLKAENLTDELGFVHTSFLKDDAPVRGRNITLGLRGEF